MSDAPDGPIVRRDTNGFGYDASGHLVGYCGPYSEDFEGGGFVGSALYMTGGGIIGLLVGLAWQHFHP